MKRKRIALIGASGRMGQAIASALQKDKSVSLDLGFSKSRPSEKVVKQFFVYKTKFDLKDFNQIDLIIDFSSSSCSLKALKLATHARIPFISGTTGFSKKQFAYFERASKKIPIFYSSNFSFGILVLRKILSDPQLKKFFQRVEIEETHHRLKKDRPSGTAKTLQKDLSLDFGPVRIHSIRKGVEPGHHRVLFKNNFEQIELSHKAFSREVFSNSISLILNFMAGKRIGFFDMMSL